MTISDILVIIVGPCTVTNEILKIKDKIPTVRLAIIIDSPYGIIKFDIFFNMLLVSNISPLVFYLLNLIINIILSL